VSEKDCTGCYVLAQEHYLRGRAELERDFVKLRLDRAMSVLREVADAYLTEPAQPGKQWGFCGISEFTRARAEKLIEEAGK
jgi:hypothetical protein